MRHNAKFNRVLKRKRIPVVFPLRIRRNDHPTNVLTVRRDGLITQLVFANDHVERLLRGDSKTIVVVLIGHVIVKLTHFSCHSWVGTTVLFLSMFNACHQHRHATLQKEWKWATRLTQVDVLTVDEDRPSRVGNSLHDGEWVIDVTVDIIHDVTNFVTHTRFTSAMMVSYWSPYIHQSNS